MLLAVGFGRSGCDRVRFSLRPSHRGQSAEQTASSALTAKRVVLSGHRPAWATVQNDEGALAGDDSLRQFSIVLKRSAQRQASFERLRCDQQDPDSVDYHHWLTPLQIGEKFGVAQADIDMVAGWLRARLSTPIPVNREIFREFARFLAAASTTKPLRAKRDADLRGSISQILATRTGNASGNDQGIYRQLEGQRYKLCHLA